MGSQSISLWQVVLVGLAGWINQHQQHIIDYKDEEIRILKEQLGNRRLRFTNEQRRRLAAMAKKLGRGVLKEMETIVTPDTLLRWYRRLIARKYDGTKNRGLGRPKLGQYLRQLALTFALQNRTWGYDRIQGTVSNLGYDVSASSIANILEESGIGPAPGRGRTIRWSQFLKSHWESLAAADFFTVEVFHGFRLYRYLVFFVINLPTRRVEIAGIAPDPDGTWMEQVARNLTDCIDGFLEGKRYLIVDNDTLYTKKFGDILKSAGVELKKITPRSPNLNAFAERLVRSIKSECVSNFIFFSAGQLQHVICEYVAHYNRERNHQGIDNLLIEPDETAFGSSGRIECKERLGGMLKYYCRAA